MEIGLHSNDIPPVRRKSRVSNVHTFDVLSGQPERLLYTRIYPVISILYAIDSMHTSKERE